MLLSISACSSVDLDPTDMYDMAYAMKNETNADLYLNSFYSIAAQWGSFGSCALGGANSNLSDGLTDILKYGSIAAGAGDCNLIMTVDGQQRVDQTYFDSWTTGYGLIRRINEALQALDTYNANFTASQSSRIRAELLFFRSHVQFNIMRCHASEKDDLGIIIHKTLSEMSVANKNTARKSVSESWDASLEDLNFACDVLPEQGRPFHQSPQKFLLCLTMPFSGKQGREFVPRLLLRQKKGDRLFFLACLFFLDGDDRL